MRPIAHAAGDVGDTMAAMTLPPGPVVLDAATVRGLVPLSAVLEPTRRALIAHACGQVSQPAPWHLDVAGGAVPGEVHVKGAWRRGAATYAVKLATGFPGNADLGVSTSSGLSIVGDAETGVPRLICLDGGWLTDARTAAAGALATDALALPGAVHLAIVGAGVQARLQVEALGLLRHIASIHVCVRDASRAASWVSELTAGAAASGLGAVTVGSVADGIPDGVTAVVTTTPAHAPVVSRVPPGCQVTAIGSDGPGKRELGVELVLGADLFAADDLDQSRRLGELQGCPRPAVTLGDILDGAHPGRSTLPSGAVTVCDLTGIGAQDAAMGELVIERYGRARRTDD